MERDKENKRGHDKGLLALALFKWFKGLVLLLVGVGFLKLLHPDLETKAPSLLKCATLVINVAIAIFLIVRVRASNVEELPRSDKARSA